MLQKRREQKVQSSGLDDGDHELLQQNRVERDEMTKEIQELRERSVSVYHVFFFILSLQRRRLLEPVVSIGALGSGPLAVQNDRAPIGTRSSLAVLAVLRRLPSFHPIKHCRETLGL